MKSEKEIRDDEIRILGDTAKSPSKSSKSWWWIILGLIIIALVAVVWYTHSSSNEVEVEESFFEPEIVAPAPIEKEPQVFGSKVDSLRQGFIELQDTLVNDIPLRLSIPHNAELTLQLGKLPKQDTSIIYCAQAADIRRDNHRIVGAFVLKGEPLAWGLSKKGYCAIIDGKISIGVSENSPLFEEATIKQGYFFRQYALVDNGKIVDNEPKNKSIRRALCERNGQVLMVMSLSNESFHDFAQALVDLGMRNAIYLVGSSAYGWAIDEHGEKHEFGLENSRKPRFTSYIVWRKK